MNEHTTKERSRAVELFDLLEKLGLSLESHCRGGFVTKLGTTLGVGFTLILFLTRR